MGPDYLDSHQVGLSFTNFSSYPYLKHILDWLSTLLREKNPFSMCDKNYGVWVQEMHIYIHLSFIYNGGFLLPEAYSDEHCAETS